MRIKIIIDGADEQEMRAAVSAHFQVLECNAADTQPVSLEGSTHRGRPFVGVEGPSCYGIETTHLSPAGAVHVLDALLASTHTNNEPRDYDLECTIDYSDERYDD